jgi:hypothetical protein
VDYRDGDVAESGATGGFIFIRLHTRAYSQVRIVDRFLGKFESQRITASAEQRISGERRVQHVSAVSIQSFLWLCTVLERDKYT